MTHFNLKDEKIKKINLLSLIFIKCTGFLLTFKDLPSTTNQAFLILFKC